MSAVFMMKNKTEKEREREREREREKRVDNKRNKNIGVN
jgi:hypothetical protein